VADLMLFPAIVTFFVPYNPPASSVLSWNTVIMMTGIIVTRGGSIALSLAQTKQLQMGLADHP